MAKIAQRSFKWIFTLKLLLLSTGAFSMVVILKFSVPLLLDFMVSTVPQLWISIRSWLTPPYLYIVINGIIITIAASSGFQHKLSGQQELVTYQKPPGTRPDFEIPVDYDPVVLKSLEEATLAFEIPRGYDARALKGIRELSPAPSVLTADVDEDADFISRSDYSIKRRDSSNFSSECLFAPEKPLASVRIGHRKSVKASPEGKALGVARPKRAETFESTWKTITDGRPVPLARHLRKSDTWETHSRLRSDAASTHMKKLDTFSNRNPAVDSSPSPGSGKHGPRKEPSMSQDELNRRVEAFIKKFNEEIRLQRQESLRHYAEMMNRGTH